MSPEFDNTFSIAGIYCSYCLKFKPNIRTGKKGHLIDFLGDMIVGARPAGLSISETVDLLGFSHTAICRLTGDYLKSMPQRIKAALKVQTGVKLFSSKVCPIKWLMSVCFSQYWPVWLLRLTYYLSTQCFSCTSTYQRTPVKLPCSPDCIVLT